MKKELPVPAVVAGVVALAAIVGIVIWSLAGAGGEIKSEVPKSPGYIEGIPAYVKEGRAPRAGEMPEGAGGAPASAAAPK